MQEETAKDLVHEVHELMMQFDGDPGDSGIGMLGHMEMIGKSLVELARNSNRRHEKEFGERWDGEAWVKIKSKPGSRHLISGDD
jgi:hypothetical protein